MAVLLFVWLKDGDSFLGGLFTDWKQLDGAADWGAVRVDGQVAGMTSTDEWRFK